MSLTKITRVFVCLMLLIVTGIMAVACTESAPEPVPASTPEQVPAPASTPAAQPETEVKEMKWSSPPKMEIDTGKKYTAVIETAKGNLVIELFAKDAPNTVNNFVFLSRQGYYNGTTFHRVLPDFMAQGGDPTGTGTGGPGYRFADEFSDRGHEAGTLSMANSGADTNGSQFFITYVPTHYLDGKHTVFGKLIEGMDVLKSLTPRNPDTNPKFTGDKIISLTIKEE